MNREFDRGLRVLRLTAFAAAVLMPFAAFAQVPASPKTEQSNPASCAPADARATVGQGGDLAMPKSGGNLSEKLARSDGVICPPEQVDPQIKAVTPPGGSMPVIPPPGSPGGDPNVHPK
jgi:hypothetical protein